MAINITFTTGPGPIREGKQNDVANSAVLGSVLSPLARKAGDLNSGGQGDAISVRFMFKLVRLFLFALAIGSPICAQSTKDSQQQLVKKSVVVAGQAVEIVEVKREKAISRCIVRGIKPVGIGTQIMTLADAVYEIATQRGAPYFIVLSERDLPDSSAEYLIGFSQKAKIDIHKEFGRQFRLRDEEGEPRRTMSTKDAKFLLGR